MTINETVQLDFFFTLIEQPTYLPTYNIQKLSNMYSLLTLNR